MADRGAAVFAVERAGGDLHQQGRRRDAWARGRADAARRARAHRGHLPRHRASAPAPALARGGLERDLPDPRCRRPGAPGQAHHHRAGRRRRPLPAAPGDVVHQRGQGRGQAARRHRSRLQPLHAHAGRHLSRLRGRLQARRAGRLRRAAAARARTVPARRQAARALPRALPAPPDRRVPGHQHHPVRLDPRARGRDRESVRGRRRRPGDLRLARGQGRERAAVPARFPRRAHAAARAELPLHRPHPRRSQRDHRQQSLAPGQVAVDRGRARRADRGLRGLQRRRGGALRDRARAPVGARGRAPFGMRDPVPLQRAVAAVRGTAAGARDAVPRVWRPALLRARRGPRCAGMDAAGGLAPRRHRLRARDRGATARSRRAQHRCASPPRARRWLLAVGRGVGRTGWRHAGRTLEIGAARLHVPRRYPRPRDLVRSRRSAWDWPCRSGFSRDRHLARW